MKLYNISFEAIESVEEKRIIDTKKFDFSTIAGKLQWEGNALEEQKKLRAEWDFDFPQNNKISLNIIEINYFSPC